MCRASTHVQVQCTFLAFCMCLGVHVHLVQGIFSLSAFRVQTIYMYMYALPCLPLHEHVQDLIKNTCKCTCTWTFFLLSAYPLFSLPPYNPPPTDAFSLSPLPPPPLLISPLLSLLIPFSSSSSSKHSGPDTNVVWSGGTCQRHLVIAANSVQTVRVFANFSKAGVYNLHNVKVWATLDGSSNYHIQRWQRTSLISIAE